MTRVLIPTMVGDDHARVVACAAERRDYHAVRWFTADFPSRQTISIEYTSTDSPKMTLRGPELDGCSGEFDVVWLRRPVPPVLPDTLHPEDRPVAILENTFFHRSLWQSMCNQASWINRYDAHLAARSKALQLRLAPDVGLQIPPTLISNDPEQIAAFIVNNRPTATIYKSFYPTRWDLPNGAAAVLETSKVDLESLPSPDVLRLTPGIFQPYVEKAFEVRATFFGAHVIAMRLNSQQTTHGRTDYRSATTEELAAAPFTLPSNIYRSARQLMRRLGIVFGCFDFIVTPEKEFVFLEVNEMGQFLWQEVCCPEATVLDIFLDFLANPSPDFVWHGNGTHISLRSVVESDKYQRMVQTEAALHVPTNPYASLGAR